MRRDEHQSNLDREENDGDPEETLGAQPPKPRSRAKRIIKYALYTLLVLVVLDALTMIYFVDETEMAIIKRGGNAVRFEPYSGPHKKLPWPIESVQFQDDRLIKYDATPREIITADKKTLVVDLFAYYRVVNGVLFVQKLQTEENANIRVDDTAYSEVRATMGARDLHKVVTTDRLSVADTVQIESNKNIQPMGLEAAAVQISKTELPAQNKPAVYERMKSERGQIAKSFRSEGDEEATKIRAAADKEARTLKANAYKEAEGIRGDGEKQATGIYAKAYSKDPNFFAFWRSIQAANKSLNSGGTIDFYYRSGDVPHLEWLKK